MKEVLETGGMPTQFLAGAGAGFLVVNFLKKIFGRDFNSYLVGLGGCLIGAGLREIFDPGSSIKEIPTFAGYAGGIIFGAMPKEKIYRGFNSLRIAVCGYDLRKDVYTDFSKDKDFRKRMKKKNLVTSLPFSQESRNLKLAGKCLEEGLS